MSSHSYPASNHSAQYQHDGAPFHAMQQAGNPSQPHHYAPYDSHAQSPSMAYDVSSRGYGAHLDPSNPSSPVVSIRPTPSPALPSTFVLPSHVETISPTAIYQQQPDPSLALHPSRSRSHSNPHSHSHSHSLSQPQDLRMSLMASPVSSAFPSYEDHGIPPRPSRRSQEEYDLPDPHASRPTLSVSVSGSFVGHPEGWSDPNRLDSATSEFPPPATNPTPSPRSRTVSLGGKKKKASPRTTTVPLPGRKRSPASCAPCRKKKLKCDRSLPCSSCMAKGTECIWEGDATPLYVKDQQELRGQRELQAQVDRLTAVIDELVSSPKSNKTSSLRFDSMTASEEASLDSSPSFELLAHDLSRALVEIAFDGILPPQQSGELAVVPGAQTAETFIEDARRYCKSRQRPSALVTSSLITPSASSSEVSPSSSFFPPLRAPSISISRNTQLLRTVQNGSLVEWLPPANDLDKASSHFFSSVDPLVPLFERSRFGQMGDKLRQGAEENGIVDPVSCSLVLAVAAAGLAKMSDHDVAASGIVGDRSTTVGRWLDVALHALSLSKFPESATYDGIRAALVIATVQLYPSAGSEYGSYAAAYSLLASAVQSAFELELHREPNRNGKSKFRFSECQERRRLFWALFSICSSISCDTSRVWTQFDLRYVDTHFPLDCFDDELAMDELAIRASVRARVNSETFEETPMTFNLCLARLAFVTQKISEEALAVGGCRYSKIATFHAELRKLDKSLPDCYRVRFDDDEQPFFAAQTQSPTNLKAALVQIAISSEIVRINRPFLVLATTNDAYQESRERAVLHAKRVLRLAADPVCSNVQPQLSLKVLLSAVVLAVELWQSPDESDAETLRALIASASDILESQSQFSLLVAQGLDVLRFLNEETVQASSLAAPHRHRAKRARTNRHSPDEVGFQLRQSWLHSIPNSTYPSRAGSPGSDSEVISMRRRANRPALKHSARSESHLSSRARIAPRPPALERSHRSLSAEDFPSFDPFPLPLSPATTSTSAHSVVALSPVINFEHSQSQPRNRTFSDPASSLQLTDFSRPAAGPVFRYYQQPSSSSGRAMYGTTLDTGLGLVDYADHTRASGVSSAYDGDESVSAFYRPEERMETEDLRSFDHHHSHSHSHSTSSGLDSFTFAAPPNYRHS